MAAGPFPSTPGEEFCSHAASDRLQNWDGRSRFPHADRLRVVNPDLKHASFALPHPPGAVSRYKFGFESAVRFKPVTRARQFTAAHCAPGSRWPSEGRTPSPRRRSARCCQIR
ncbi:hypothetical protein BE61_77030 [Bradyrhizobium elkanii USDA 61]|nr:hypothetical protein BE61_77030 [Bradyrhizobium elkanii USDA 61]